MTLDQVLALDNDANLDKPWEPRTFKVGDRVRIRLSGECRYPTRSIGSGRIVEHYPEQDGLEGEVLGDYGEAWGRKGHPYFVKLPEVCHETGCCMGGFFAAIELELLERSNAR